MCVLCGSCKRVVFATCHYQVALVSMSSSTNPNRTVANECHKKPDACESAAGHATDDTDGSSQSWNHLIHFDSTCTRRSLRISLLMLSYRPSRSELHLCKSGLCQVASFAHIIMNHMCMYCICIIMHIYIYICMYIICICICICICIIYIYIYIYPYVYAYMHVYIICICICICIQYIYIYMHMLMHMNIVGIMHMCIICIYIICICICICICMCI